MIVKIERYNKDQQWWLVDGVRRIAASLRMKYETEEDRKAAMAGCPEAAFLDLKKCNCSEDSSEECDKCVDHRHYRVCKLGCRMEDGSDCTIVFDTIVYVLNDQGKTIEKIVANYKK